MGEAEAPEALRKLTEDARVTVRRGWGLRSVGENALSTGWSGRSAGADNHAVEVAVALANELGLPLVWCSLPGCGGIGGGESAAGGVSAAWIDRDVEEDLARRGALHLCCGACAAWVWWGSVERLLVLEVGAAVCIGDENPLREPERWRQEVAARVRIPFWTVDADVVVPSKLMERAQYGAYTIRPRLYRMLPEFVIPFDNAKAEREWKRPKGFAADPVGEDMTRGWKGLDRSVAASGGCVGWAGRMRGWNGCGIFAGSC